MKHSYELRLKAVLNVTEGHMTIGTSAKLSGINSKDLSTWVRLYERYGSEGLIMKQGTYSRDFKKHAVEYMHKNQLSLRLAAVELGVPRHNTLSNWERIYYEEGPEALYRDSRGRKRSMSSGKPKKQKELNNQTEEDLIAEVQRLRMENEYLKKLNALVQERIARESGKKPPSSTN